MHIAIEGIDGVGKSTIASILSKELGFTLVEKPLHFLFDDEGEELYIKIRNKVNNNLNKKFTAWFYGLGNIFLYEHFKDENIITDRHLISNYCWSGTEETKYIFDAIYKTTGAPIYTFLIYANEETLKNRLKSRNINDSDFSKVKYISEAYKKMQHILDAYNMSYSRLDTSDMTIEEVISTIKNILKQNGIL